MRAIQFVDVPISEDRNILFEVNERIVGISLTNVGSDDVSIAMGSDNASKLLEAGADIEYGNVHAGSDIFYLTGNLVIKKTDGTAWDANTKVVLTYAYDRTATIDQDC